tara:strand:- start:52 stop:360 length:309 start_codon:yes stop_codon:yes gene_type:complete
MPTIELGYETELKMDGLTLNAAFAGRYQIDARTGVIDAIGVETWNGRKFAAPIKWLPDGQIYDLLHAILTDEYIDQIDEAMEEWRLAGAATHADRQHDAAMA